MRISFFSFLVSVSFILTIVSCSNTSVEEVPITNKSFEISHNYSEDDIELARVINEYRESIGLNKLDLINMFL